MWRKTMVLVKLLCGRLAGEEASEILEQIAWIGVVLVILIVVAIAIRDKLQALAQSFLNSL